MNTQKIYFFSNLRYLRERLKMSQEEISGKLDMSRTKYMQLEIGKTKSITMEDQIKISNYHRIAIDTLIQVDLSKLGELKLRELQGGNDVYIRGGNLRVLSISVDKTNKENVEYVPIKGRAGYTAGGFADPDYIADLPKYSMPNLPKHGTYRTFLIEGDSMLPFPEKMDVTGKFIEDWNIIKAETLAIVVMKGQDIVFKSVSMLENGLLQCRSLNAVYEPYTVPVEEVLEIWEYYSYTSSIIPQAQGDLDKVLQELKRLESRLMNN